MDMIQVVAQGSMKAAARLLQMPQYSGIQSNPEWSGLITAALREEIASRWDSLRAEWSEGIEANVGDGWLHQMVNLQCIQIAKAALESVCAKVA